MTRRAEAQFTIRQWNETNLIEREDGRKLTHAEVIYAYTGALEGESRVELLMFYGSDGNAVYSGFEWFIGSLEGKAGEFVSSRGLGVISDLGPGELAQRYLVRSDGKIDGKPTPYFRIMHAVVEK